MVREMSNKIVFMYGYITMKYVRKKGYLLEKCKGIFKEILLPDVAGTLTITFNTIFTACKPQTLSLCFKN